VLAASTNDNTVPTQHAGPVMTSIVGGKGLHVALGGAGHTNGVDDTMIAAGEQ
jgi:hypothetical protein